MQAHSDSPNPLRDAFDTLIALSLSERTHWLDANIGSADERAHLIRLLAAHEASGYLDTPAVQHAERLAAVEFAPTNLIGRQIGAFRIARALGQGGMAAVFLGERVDRDFIQHVAIKLLRRGLYSELEQRLFQRERQVLATLDHPNIARLIDGGVTEAGIPYLIMEFVDGVPITQYVDAQRLDVPQRLALFLAVCRAVEVAHRNLVVHRDIKPSNILVNAAGEVKLLDFGIAKLLDDEDANATSGTVGVFTPGYAAPEQVHGSAITTATDVYGLGVLLHELLLGLKPDTNADSGPRRPSSRVDEAVTARADGTPFTQKVDQLRRTLRGDLDNIILKALDEDPARRYASAGTFADDIDRYLTGRPVVAHPPTRWYRTRKFIQRHRGGVTVTAILVLAIFAALGLALWQANVAQQEAARANAVRDFLVSVFQAAGANVPKDKRPSAEALVDQATTRLIAQNDLPDSLRADLLLVLAKVAHSIGAFGQALTLLDHAQPIVDRYGKGDPRWWDTLATRAAVLKDKSPDAKVIALLDPARDELFARRDEASIAALTALGSALLHTGQVDAGLALFRRTRELAEAESARLPAAPLSVSIDEAGALLDVQRFHEGLERAESAFAIWRKQGAQANLKIVELYAAMALGAEALGDTPRAESAYKEAVALGDKFFDKPNPSTAWNVGMYGTFLIAQGRFAEAEPYARRGLEMRRTVFGDNDPRTLYAIAGMGKLYYGEEKFDEAAQWYTQGVEVCRKTALDNTVCPRLLSLRGRAYAAEDRLDDAEQDIRDAMELQRKSGGDATTAFAYLLDALAVVQVKQKRYTDTIESADRVLAIYKTVKGGMLQSELATRYWRAKALFGLKRMDEALSEILDIEPKFSTLAPNSIFRFHMLVLEARALAATKRDDEAAKAAQAALALEKKPLSVDAQTVDELTRLAHRQKAQPL